MTLLRDRYKRKMRPMTGGERVTACVCYSPCIGWSMFWRLLCCPLACCRHGLAGCCSDNECTSATDYFMFDVLEGKIADHTDSANKKTTEDGMCIPQETKKRNIPLHKSSKTLSSKIVPEDI